MKEFTDKQCPKCHLWMDALKGHSCDPELNRGGGDHWNYRVCRFISKEGYAKLGIFEVIYNEDNEPVTRLKEPKLSWFIENCGDEPTEKSCSEAAKWEVKMLLKAFRKEILDAEKDFE